MLNLGPHRGPLVLRAFPPQEAPGQEVRRFFQELTDPLQMAGFGVGMTAFRLGKLGARLLHFPRLSASLTGLGAEALAWVGTRRLGRHLFLSDDPDPWRGFGREVLAMGLTLGLLRGSGFIAEEAFGLKQGLDPASRSLLQWTSGMKRLYWACHQGGMFAGILAGEALQAPLGLNDPRSFRHLLSDSLVSLLHFNAAGSLAPPLLGQRFLHLQSALDLRSEGRRPVFEGTAPLVSTATASASLFRPWVAMSPKDKIAHFPKERIVRPQNLPRGEPVAPDWSLAEVKALIGEGEKNLNDIQLLLLQILDQAEIHRRKAGLDRLQSETVLEDNQGLRRTAGRLQKEIKLASEIHDAMVGFTLLATQMALEERRSFARVQQRYQILSRYEKTLRPLIQDFLTPPSAQEGSPVYQEHRFLGRLVENLSGKIRAEDSPPGGSYQGVLGMLLGVSVKEIFRPPFSRQDSLFGGSQRRFDLETCGKILKEMAMDAPADRNLREVFFFFTEKGGTEAPVLRFLFSETHLMEGWFGLGLPLLVARYGANYDQARARLLPLENHLPENYRPWSALTLWLLCQAVKRPGTPERWWKELPEAVRKMPTLTKGIPSVRALASAERVYLGDLKKTFSPLGQAAVVPYSLVVFLRHYDTPAKALAMARRAPVTLREDVLALTGALLGAYHGAAFYNPSLFEELTGSWKFFQESVFKEPPEVLEKRLEDLRGFWIPEKAAAKITVLDRPGRVIRSGPRGADALQKLAWIREAVQRDIQTLLELQGSLISRAYQTGITRWEWEFSRKNLRRIETGVQTFLSELRGIGELGDRVTPLRPGARSQLPNRLRQKLHEQLDAVLRQIQELIAEGEKISVSTGHVHFNLPQYRRFQVLLAEIPSFDGLRILMRGDPNQRRPLHPSDFKELFEAGLQDSSQFLPLFEEAPGYITKSPWGHVMALTKNFSGRDLRTVSLSEILDVFHRQIDWKGKKIPPFDAVAPHVIPAYLEIFQTNTLQAYRDLEILPIERAPETLEALRGMAYLSLRMLEGVSPDWQLAREYRDSFLDRSDPKNPDYPPLGRRMDALLHTHDKGRSLESLVESWIRTRLSVDKVAAAFVLTMRNPYDPLLALKEVDTWPVIRVKDDHHGLRRVTALLSHAAYLGRQNKGD